MQFFTEQRENFFRPLVSKRREMVAACLKGFYDRLYSPDESHAYHVERVELRELFAAIIRELPPQPFELVETSPEAEEFETLTDRDEYALASALLRLLMATGWVEEYLDKSTMATAFRFTRAGKHFAKAFIAQEERTLQTRQRNVRNTRNALQAFLEDGDPYNLADAHAYSLQIIEDLSDEIADLDDRKGRMMKSAETRGTIGEFLDYMENHFKPELAVKLAADSIERHRRVMLDIMDQIRAWPEEKHQQADAKLRPLIPPYMRLGAGDSPTLFLLARVEQAIDTAYHGKLSELRAALAGFSRAATQLIRQQAALRSGLGEQFIGRALAGIAEVQGADQDILLASLGRSMKQVQVSLPDPGIITLRRTTEREAPSTTGMRYEPTREEQLRSVMDQAESSAFTISPLAIRDFLLTQMEEGDGIRLSSLEPRDPPAILTIMHAIEAASVSLSDRGQALELIPLNETFETPYMTANDFLIRKAQ